jgi:hypothetical protein
MCFDVSRLWLCKDTLRDVAYCYTIIYINCIFHRLGWLELPAQEILLGWGGDDQILLAQHLGELLSR